MMIKVSFHCTQKKKKKKLKNIKSVYTHVQKKNSYPNENFEIHRKRNKREHFFLIIIFQLSFKGPYSLNYSKEVIYAFSDTTKLIHYVQGPPTKLIHYHSQGHMVGVMHL